MKDGNKSLNTTAEAKKNKEQNKTREVALKTEYDVVGSQGVIKSGL